MPSCCAGCWSDWYRLLPASPSRVPKGNLCHHGLVLVCLYKVAAHINVHACNCVIQLTSLYTTAGTQTTTFGPHLNTSCETWWQMRPSFFKWTWARKAQPAAVNLESHWSVAGKCIQICKADTLEQLTDGPFHACMFTAWTPYFPTCMS